MLAEIRIPYTIASLLRNSQREESGDCPNPQLTEKGADDIIVVAGGVTPDVKEVMLQDTPPQAIVATLRRLVIERGAR
jgi:methylmalonyl-CoA mutase cobalamin-binding subunit